MKSPYGKIVFEDRRRNVKLLMAGDGYLFLIFEPDIESSRAIFEIDLRARYLTWWEKIGQWIMHLYIDHWVVRRRKNRVWAAWTRT